MPETFASAAAGDVDAARRDRRQALSGALLLLAGSSLAAWPRSANAQKPNEKLAQTLALDRQRFVELSAKLCGMPIRARAVADVIQSAITSDTGADQLTRLAALVGQAPSETVDTLLATSDLKELAERLIAAWYTGMSGAKETRRVLSHDEALAWRATGYAKAPGTCGVFGEWTATPGSIATPSATAQGDKR